MLVSIVSYAAAFHMMNRPVNLMKLSATLVPGNEWADSTGADTEHLIDEEMVTDDMSASLLAERCMAEAHRLFTSKANWKKLIWWIPNSLISLLKLFLSMAAMVIQEYMLFEVLVLSLHLLRSSLTFRLVAQDINQSTSTLLTTET